ncbi:glutamate racemase [bacterium]|nr:glutamate racemase [bacterium]MBU1983248.1 glutamate racemase [bacterium]
MSSNRASQPIAIFDSGLGGLTVVAEIHRQLPHENLLFLADRARVPYASQSVPLIARWASECFDFLLAHDPKAVVIACNTVSAVYLNELREQTPVPVIGVIEPTARAAVKATRSGRIGVVATKATVRRRAYDVALAHLRADLQIASSGAALLVPLVEEGWTTGEIPRKVVEHYLEPLKRERVDTVVLGCTHYEYFVSIMQQIMGNGVQIINTPHVTTLELVSLLTERNELRSENRAGTVGVYSTDINEALERVVNDLFAEGLPTGQITVQSAQIPPFRARLHHS